MHAVTTVDKAEAPGNGRATARRSLIWSAVENFGLMLISFGALVLYSRMLTASEFGLFSMVLAVVELIDLAVRMFFHDALVQRAEATALHFDTAFTATLVAGFLAMGACVALAPLFQQMVQVPNAAAVLAWTSLCVPCGALTATIVALQRRNLSFRALAVRSLVGRLAGAFVGLGLVLAGAGIWGLVAQQVLIAAVASLALWLGCDQRPRLRFGLRELRDLAGFGLSSIGTQMLTFAVKRVFTFMAGALLGVQAAGVLNLAMRTVDTLYSVASTAVSQVAMPMLASLRSDRGRMARAYRLATALSCAVLYGLFFGLAALAPEVVRVMFGERWADAAFYVTVLSCLALVQGPRLLMGPLLTAVGRPADAMLARAAELAFLVIALLCLREASLGTVLAVWAARELLGFPIMLWLVRRGARISVVDQLRGMLTPLLASTACVLAIVATRHQLQAQLAPAWQLAALCAVGALAYLGTLVLVDRPLLREVRSLARARHERQAAAA